MSFMLLTFFIVLVIVLLIWRMVCPNGATMMVLCLFPPFIKRVRIYGNKWIGFDSKWEFMLLKDVAET